MMTAAQALRAIYEQAMQRACNVAQHGDHDLAEAAQAEFMLLNYHGVHEDADELMRDQDDMILCVLVTGDVCRQVGDHEVQWSTVDLKAMN